MSPEKQRIAIATARGLQNVAPVIVQNVKHQGDDITVGISSASGWIPDYLGDLNACHEMEKGLDYEQCEAFSTTLADIVHAANREKDYAFPWAFARIHATAGQRAEAFLRTLGLWQETPTQPQ